MSNRLPRWLADLPLGHKLLLMTMGVVLAATATTLAFMHRQAREARSAEFVQNSVSAARLVADYAAAPMVFEDENGAREVLAKLALDPRVRYARLEDGTGKAFAAVGDARVAAPALGSEASRLERDVLHVAVPVMAKGRLGTLRVGFHTAALEEAVGSQLRFLLLVLIAVVLASLVLARKLQALVTAPVLALEAHAREMAETQDFSRQLEPPGRDEIGSLYRGFNDLLARIRRHQEDILALNRSLEDKVAERTRDLEAARDRADKASLSKSEFLANMSHEIRTPINAITGFTALALRTRLDARQADYLDKIQTASHGLLHIVNDLLDFSKIEAGHLTLEHIPFRLAEVLETMVAYVGTTAERKGLELLVEVAPDVPTHLVGDPMRLGQVLVNLCSNAVKFTARGEVGVSVSVLAREGSHVRLRFAVRDTGIGLSSEQIARLFQAFSQADASTTRRFGGTGLGLAISKRIVTLMGGEIGVESRPDEGSTFRFEVALQAAPDGATGEVTLPERLRRERALVVDDNPHARQILVDQLAQLGMSATAVESGDAAIAELRAASSQGRPYPVVLMDWRMPAMDGLGATRAIRADPAISHTPVVIMVTAFGREQALGSAENAALLDGVLLKPVTPSLLASTLAQLLEPGARDRAAAEAVRRAALPGVRVLLVEDNPVNQQLATELLQQEGAEVTWASNGRLALEVLARRGLAAFDVALVDLQMPEMDGFETTRRLRALEGGSALPVIALTAHALHEERERCLAAGMNDHVAKPIDPEILVAKVALWVGTEGLARAAVRAAPAVPAALSVVDLPAELPGIARAEALARCHGDTRLLRDLLLAFRRGHADSGAELEALIDRGDLGGARHLAHAVKGAAANLGATRVARAAGEIEKGLAEGRDVRVFASEFSAALREIDHAVAPLEPRPLPSARAGDASVPRALRVRLTELLECLRHNDTRAEAIVEELKARWPGSPPAWMARAERAIRELEYPAAQAEVEAALAAEAQSA